MAYQMLEMQNQKQVTEIGNLQQSTEANGSALNQDFFQDEKVVSPKKKQQQKAKKVRVRKIKTPYSPTKIKARNYLSNIAYSRTSEADFKNTSFIADALTFITMDLKPLFLKITYCDEGDIGMIKILWEKCLPPSYIQYLRNPENFELIYSDKANCKQIKNIIGRYMLIVENCRDLISSFQKYQDNYQYIYAHIFPKTYSKNEGFQKKIHFTQCFSSWKQKKMQQSIGKNPFNFAAAPEVHRHPMEQAPITDEINLYDDLEFKADVVDTKPQITVEAEGPKPTTSINERFLYAPTMVGMLEFDKKFKLPKQKKT